MLSLYKSMVKNHPVITKIAIAAFSVFIVALVLFVNRPIFVTINIYGVP